MIATGTTKPARKSLNARVSTGVTPVSLLRKLYSRDTEEVALVVIGQAFDEADHRTAAVLG